MESRNPSMRAMEELHTKVRPDELGDGSGAAPAATETPERESSQPLAAIRGHRVTSPPGSHPITIDAGIVRGKALKSIAANCKIEYA